MTGIPTAPLPDLITISPDPPVPGQDAEICFKFAEGHPSPISLEVTWTPVVGQASTVTVQVSREAPCVKVHVPSNAATFLIVDQSGTSAALGGATA